MGLKRGGTEKEKKEKEKEKEEKFPLCMKAKVIGPFGAAAQKHESIERHKRESQKTKDEITI